MTTTNLTVARTDVPTDLSYEALVQRFEATLGTWWRRQAREPAAPAG